MPAELRLLFALLLALVVVPGAAAAPGVTQGKHLYGRYCIACHGMNGSGVAPSREAGAGPGRAQTQQHVVGPPLRGVGARAADFYLRTGYMPLQKIGEQPRRSTVIFDEQELRSLIAYVASLGGGPPIPRPHPDRGDISLGQHLFTDHCAGCHQVMAEGGYVTGSVPPALENATPAQVAEAVRIGPNVMPKFSPKAITPHELDSIIRYVEYTKRPDDRGGWALGHLGPVPEGLVTFFIGALALVLTCMAIGKRLHGE